MRTRWLVSIVGIVAVAGAVFVVRAFADSESLRPGPSAGREEASASAELPARTVTAGAVEISIEPIQIDDTAAVFRIVMNTHSEELSADLVASSALEVDGVKWSQVSWSGDPPGGHHRQGELAFEANGDATESATLSIGGFAAPVEASWSLGT